MAIWQKHSRRKPSGGMRRPHAKKKRREIGREREFATVGSERRKVIRVLGGRRKVRLLRAEWADLFDPQTGKTERTRILSVKTNPANPNFVTRNIVTRGATIETENGIARVTSRPGQVGTVHAVLLTEPE
ncbi:MAG: 30S ribosomal protein S8e [Candidatus Thermoplasmatota archaeon]|nr:30S ribosomal protein S8e [Candidatus Thermoplasmatota archaeon]